MIIVCHKYCCNCFIMFADCFFVLLSSVALLGLCCCTGFVARQSSLLDRLMLQHMAHRKGDWFNYRFCHMGFVAIKSSLLDTLMLQHRVHRKGYCFNNVTKKASNLISTNTPPASRYYKCWNFYFFMY